MSSGPIIFLRYDERHCKFVDSRRMWSMSTMHTSHREHIKVTVRPCKFKLSTSVIMRPSGIAHKAQCHNFMSRLARKPVRVAQIVAFYAVYAGLRMRTNSTALPFHLYLSLLFLTLCILASIKLLASYSPLAPGTSCCHGRLQNCCTNKNASHANARGALIPCALSESRQDNVPGCA